MAKTEAENNLKYNRIELGSPADVGQWVKSPRALLENSSIMAQKAFLRSFVERIEVGDSEVKIVYTMPMTPDSYLAESVPVLPIVQNGSPTRART